MRRVLLSMMLAIALAANTMMLTACSEDTVKVIKQKVSDIQIYADELTGFITDLKNEGTLPADKAENTLLALREIKNGAEEFVAQGQGITKFDPNSKADWLKLFQRVVKGIKAMKEKAGPDFIAILKALNVSEPEKWATRINGIIRLLDAASRAVESRLSN